MMWIFVIVINFFVVTVLLYSLRKEKNLFLKVFVVGFIVLGSTGLYLYLGSPDYPDQPIEARREIMRENLADWLLLERDLPKSDARRETLTKMIEKTAELLEVDLQKIRTHSIVKDQ